MAKVRRRTLALAAAILIAGLTGCMPRQPWHNELVSVNAAGTDSGNGWSTAPVFSPDGTRVAFLSTADDLGPTDTNGVLDLYLRELSTGTTTLVSANAAGTDSADDGAGPGISFSPDGEKIAFVSTADDLGPIDTNGQDDVYLRDLRSGTTTLVSASAAGDDAGNGRSSNPMFSPDGTKVLFQSGASDLGPADPDGTGGVYLHDLASQSTALVSVNAAGTGNGNGPSTIPPTAAFSPDGTKVVFTSRATDLGPTDTDSADDVYVRDLLAGTTTLVSVNAGGTDSGANRSGSPAISPDGTRVVFTSTADDLGPRDTNDTWDATWRRERRPWRRPTLAVRTAATGGPGAALPSIRSSSVLTARRSPS